MQLRIATPAAIYIDTPVTRLTAESPAGFFGILPRHGDFVAQLVPGILVYAPQETDAERFVAINSGTLIKSGDLVRVAVHGAIAGDDLDLLKQRVETEFRKLDEDERNARAALARLEVTMIHRFRDLEKVRP
ncbi:F0F1 ATP synthase subunit epsilon [Yoonia sp.]|uniref:F0F1 ATP synthase subunit epsilon n=1 Tax=Yoonia sp. TaxID=2212373 RepID=UPI0019E3A5B0|nr:F0F1 ATP synthase subunit epsilon [Yoonia sp.]MBE0413956.1 F0F1 ATP synthase subunit epsilon [Yoonia sp.]